MSPRVATDVGPLELADYQRTVRLLLANPIVTESHPDAATLPMIRRWAGQLRADVREIFGYRLELSTSTARLVRAFDDLDDTQPAKTGTKRPFNRQRYAYLALTLATLGRAGSQIALTELADAVGADAVRIPGLGLDTERAADRAAFVDAVGWLQTRGAVRLADGSAKGWVDDPRHSEALYDIDREVVGAVYRPTRVLQHLRGVTALLDRRSGEMSGNTRRAAAGQQARRLVVEQPVVYYAETAPEIHNHLRAPALAEDIERLTGLLVERRAGGVALIDTSGSLSDRRFPGNGAVAQAALLLLGEIADRVVDPDAEPLPHFPAPDLADRRDALAAAVDQGIPSTGVLDEIADLADGSDPADLARRYAPTGLSDADAHGTGTPGEAPDDADEAEPTHPLVPDSWLHAAMERLFARYGIAFGAQWRADPDRLLRGAIDLLAGMRVVARVDGGVLVLPLLGRYRNVVAEVRRRSPQPALFEEPGEREVPQEQTGTATTKESP